MSLPYRLLPELVFGCAGIGVSAVALFGHASYIRDMLPIASGQAALYAGKTFQQNFTLQDLCSVAFYLSRG